MVEGHSRYLAAQQRNSSIKESKNEIEKKRSMESFASPWPYRDSSLLPTSSRPYENIDATFDGYFREVLPDQQNIQEYIETTLASKKGLAVGLELGGVASRLFSQFTPGFFAQTAGVSLVDNRTIIHAIPINIDEDAARQHTVIEGDILTKETRNKVEDWLARYGKAKVDVIFERMLDGIKLLPQDSFFLTKQAQHWYRFLADDGLAFVQIPTILKSFLPEWVEFIHKQYPNKFSMQFIQEQKAWGHGILRLQKQEGAPAELPLPVHMTLSAYRQQLKGQ